MICDLPIIDPDDIRPKNKIFKMDDLPKEEIIYLLEMINKFRSKNMVDEFMNFVLNVKEIMKKFELKEPIPTFFMREYEIYELFQYLVDYIFQEYVDAYFFMNEPELAEYIIGDISESYKAEKDFSTVNRLNDLPRIDGIRLLRIFNSFRKSYIVDQFLTQIGDIENIYEFFSHFVDYIFKEYDKANYFKNN